MRTILRPLLYQHGTDTVDAKLTPREAVLNRNAAELAGRGYIRHLNNMGNELARRGVDLAARGHYQRGIEDLLGPLLAAKGITEVKYPTLEQPPKRPPLYKLPPIPPRRGMKYFPGFQDGTSDVITDPNDPRLPINQGMPGGYPAQSSPVSVASTITGGSTGHRDAVARGLIDIGARPHVVAGLLGDAEQESSFKPNLVGDKGTSFGLFQVGKPMFNKFQATQKDVDPSSSNYSYNQTQYVLNQFKQQHPDRWEAMQAAPDAPSALRIFRSTPDWGYGIAGNRYQYAQNYAQTLGGLPAGQYPTVPLAPTQAMAPMMQTPPTIRASGVFAGVPGGQNLSQMSTMTDYQIMQEQAKQQKQDLGSIIGGAISDMGTDIGNVAQQEAASARSMLNTPVQSSGDPLAPLRMIQPIQPWGS